MKLFRLYLESVATIAVVMRTHNLMNKQTDLVGSNLLVENYLVAEPTNVWPAEWSNLI